MSVTCVFTHLKDGSHLEHYEYGDGTEDYYHVHADGSKERLTRLEWSRRATKAEWDEREGRR